ncbi:MAG: DUF3450 domain-containing protein [Cycloclasticus sp.]
MNKASSKFGLLGMVLALNMVSGHGAAAEADSVLAEGKSKTVAAQTSQNKIDKLAGQTYDILQDFRLVNKQLEGIKVYNAQLEKQLENQQKTMLDIAFSIENATVIERQIIPLAIKMLDALEQYVNLDIPFLRDTRLTSISQVRENLQATHFSTSEKFRQVLELYDIESEYGSTIDQYSGLLGVEGKERKVTFMRVGRIAFLYQSSDQNHTGVWNARDKKWDPVDSSDFRSSTAKAIRIAKKQAAIDVLDLPIAFPEVAK